MPLPRPKSLLTQIVVRLTLLTLVAIAAAYVWLYTELATAADTLRNDTVALQARTVAEHLAIKDGRVTLNLPPALARTYAQSDSLYRYAVLTEDDQVLFSAGWPQDEVPLIPAEGKAGEIFDYDPDGPGPQRFVAAAIRVDLGEHRLWVAVEQRHEDYHVLLDVLAKDFFIDGGWLAAPFFLLLLMASIVSIRRTLLPLQELSRRAGEIGPASLEARLPEDGVPREVLPLVKAVNSGVDRLQAAFRIQREFTADAAHELRTPLAVLAAQIDTMADREAAVQLRKDLDVMARLVAQLLKVAQLEAMAFSAEEKADIAAVATEVASFLAPLAVRDGKSIEVEGADHAVNVRGNAGALHSAIRNLAENALVHSDKGQCVTIRVTAEPAIHVVDHGPGIPEDQRDAVFRRFWRASRNQGGAGLGLAIVRTAMEAHGGNVSITTTPGGGATFSLRFPALSGSRQATLPLSA